MHCVLQFLSFPRVKQRLHFYMQSTNDFSDKSVNEVKKDMYDSHMHERAKECDPFAVSFFPVHGITPIPQLNPTDSSSICTSLRSVRNPHRYCQKVYETIDALLTELEEIHHKHPNGRLQSILLLALTAILGESMCSVNCIKFFPCLLSS